MIIDTDEGQCAAVDITGGESHQFILRTNSARINITLFPSYKKYIYNYAFSSLLIN